MSIEIIHPGLLTTIQDLGRYGYQKEGIIVSGAMDRLALRIANLLVGNNEEDAGIEVTWMGPKIYFKADQLIAITGANLSPSIYGIPVQLWKPVFVKKESILEFGVPLTGCRAYIAVSGSFELPKVLGSKSTYLRANLGGLHGKALQAGDSIPCNGPTQQSNSIIHTLENIKNKNSFVQTKWRLASDLYLTYKHNPTIRAVQGPEYSWFTQESRITFWRELFLVNHQSDRMGYRLKGATLSLTKKRELLSGAVTFGTVQVPTEGNPIVLMADHQTTGGYPKIAQVASADFSTLAQVPPGKSIRFQEISLQEAQHLYIEQEQKMKRIKRAIQIKMK